MQKISYKFPIFLEGKCSPKAYARWLHRKASAHFKRDNKKNYTGVHRSAYKVAIRKAVIRSEGRDEYTGLMLDWALLSKWDNVAAKNGKRGYKRKFTKLPTVGHIGDSSRPAQFKICAWEVNDCKSDLSLPQFLSLCRRVINFCSNKKK